jgi:hypothetical protein
MSQMGFFDADMRLSMLSLKGDPLEAIDVLLRMLVLQSLYNLSDWDGSDGRFSRYIEGLANVIGHAAARLLHRPERV